MVVIMEGSTLGDGRHFQERHSQMPIGPKALLSRRAASRRRWRRFCPSRGRRFHSSYWFMRTLDHLCRECKKFWVLWIVRTAIIVKGWMNVVSNASRCRHEKRDGEKGDPRAQVPVALWADDKWKWSGIRQ